MTNCQLSILGEVTFACRADMTLKQCNEGMSSRAFDLFGNIFANVDRCARLSALRLPCMARLQSPVCFVKSTRCSLLVGRSNCLFLLNQHFQRRTEHLLNSLHTSASVAEEALSSVFGSLNKAQARCAPLQGALAPYQCMPCFGPITKC